MKLKPYLKKIDVPHKCMEAGMFKLEQKKKESFANRNAALAAKEMEINTKDHKFQGFGRKARKC